MGVIGRGKREVTFQDSILPEIRGEVLAYSSKQLGLTPAPSVSCIGDKSVKHRR